MQRLRELRRNRGISMKELGRCIGLAESTISLYENGKREPDNCTLVKLAEYFNVSTDYLLGKESAPNSTEKQPTDEDIKFALFGDTEIDDDVYDEVKRFAQYVKDKKDADKRNLQNG